MLSQIEALFASIEQPSIYTIDDSSAPLLEDNANTDPRSVDRALPILMDKIEIRDADTNDESPSTQTSKRSRLQPRYQTSTDLAINTLDVLA